MLSVIILWLNRRKSHIKPVWQLRDRAVVFSSWSADPRCPFKHPLFFFNWPPGCSPTSTPHPSARRVANQVRSYLRSEPPGLLVYRCVPGRHLGQTARREGQVLIPLSAQMLWLWLVEDEVEADFRSAFREGNWSQNHKAGGCRDTWRSESSGGGQFKIKCETLNSEAFRKNTKQGKVWFPTEDCGDLLL